jgi:hypothetical protein
MASKDFVKSDSVSQTPAVSEATQHFTSFNKVYLFSVLAALTVFEFWYHGLPSRLEAPLIEHDRPGTSGQLVRSYNLQIGQRWMNQGLRRFILSLHLTETDKPSRRRQMASNARVQWRDPVSNFVRPGR